MKVFFVSIIIIFTTLFTQNQTAYSLIVTEKRFESEVSISRQDETKQNINKTMEELDIELSPYYELKTSIQKKLSSKIIRLSYTNWLSLIDDLVLIENLIAEAKLRNYNTSQTVSDLHQSLAVALTRAKFPGSLKEINTNPFSSEESLDWELKKPLDKGSMASDEKSATTPNEKNAAYVNYSTCSIAYYSPPKVIETYDNFFSIFFNRRESLESKLFDEAEKNDLKLKFEFLYKRGLKDKEPSLESAVTVEIPPEILKEVPRQRK